ncbi:MAG: hypothetical protein ING64_09780 [Rhodocyclaceae bacterium]|nr:hypothetical protein [Rhodocyclaceae bacterium]
MRVSKNQITLLSAAVAGLFATGATAQVTLSSSNPTVSATAGKVYAAEINNNVAIGAATTVNTILGIGTSAGQQRYVRFAVSGGTFQNAPTLANATFPNITVGANITPTIALGGNAGANSVIFQITTPNGANITDGIALNLPAGINISGTSAPATVTYEVYEFLSDAQSQTKVLYGPRTGTLATFAPSYVFKNNATTVPTQVATSISGFTAFNFGASGSSASAANQALIGAFDIGVATNAPNLPAGTTIAALADFLSGSSNSQITVTGDFAAAAANTSVTLGTANANGGTAFTGTQAVFNINATAFANGTQVKYLVNGSTPVASVPNGYSATLSAAPNGTTFKTTTASISNTGTITRDGVVYQAPWASATPGFLSRFFLTQTAGSSVSWSAIVRNGDGPVTGGTLSGSLETGKVTQVTLASLLPATPPAGPFQVTFTIAADASQAQGSYVLTTPSGSVTSVPLYRASQR